MALFIEVATSVCAGAVLVALVATVRSIMRKTPSVGYSARARSVSPGWSYTLLSESSVRGYPDVVGTVDEGLSDLRVWYRTASVVKTVGYSVWGLGGEARLTFGGTINPASRPEVVSWGSTWFTGVVSTTSARIAASTRDLPLARPGGLRPPGVRPWAQEMSHRGEGMRRIEGVVG
jgi:hypothetical protein